MSARLQASAARIGEEALAQALTCGASLAEIYLKAGESIACEVGPDGGLVLVEREETGLALRVWLPGGREGCAHADAAADRSPERLVEAACRMAAHSAGGGVPRLPHGRAPERLAPQTGTIESKTIVEFARRLRAAFEAHSAGRVALEGIRVEAGDLRMRVLNSLGRDVAWGQSPLAVELRTRATGRSTSASVRTSAGTEAATWSVRGGEDIFQGGVDPEALAEEACLRALDARGGRRDPPPWAQVLLDPCASAAWIRGQIPFFVKEWNDHDVGQEEAGGAERGERESRRGLDLLDDPDPGTFDGEGRTARGRMLVRNGSGAEWIRDPSDPSAADDEVGPVRRDSYRDIPEPGPFRLALAPSPSEWRVSSADVDSGLHVRALSPLSVPGSIPFRALVRGLWVERGRVLGPAGPFLVKLPAGRSLPGVVGWGTDPRLDLSGVPVNTPPILIEGAALVRI